MKQLIVLILVICIACPVVIGMQSHVKQKKIIFDPIKLLLDINILKKERDPSLFKNKWETISHVITRNKTCIGSGNNYSELLANRILEIERTMLSRLGIRVFPKKCYIVKEFSSLADNLYNIAQITLRDKKTEKRKTIL